MFTGIIETVGTIKSIRKEGSNVHFTIQSSISEQLKIDQSVAHNGVCLTVVNLQDDTHTVTAIEETLLKSSLGGWEVNSKVNLERCLKVGDRLDGHFVQGHIDTTGKCTHIENRDGSWNIEVQYDSQHDYLLVDKGSICVDGVSLTVVKAQKGLFSISIIPYTFEHTNFAMLKKGQIVNLEFDILGKYIAKSLTTRTR